LKSCGARAILLSPGPQEKDFKYFAGMVPMGSRLAGLDYEHAETGRAFDSGGEILPHGRTPWFMALV
jgi:hypothetical protein